MIKYRVIHTTYEIEGFEVVREEGNLIWIKQAGSELLNRDAKNSYQEWVSWSWYDTYEEARDWAVQLAEEKLLKLRMQVNEIVLALEKLSK